MVWQFFMNFTSNFFGQCPNMRIPTKFLWLKYKQNCWLSFFLSTNIDEMKRSSSKCKSVHLSSFAIWRWSFFILCLISISLSGLPSFRPSYLMMIERALVKSASVDNGRYKNFRWWSDGTNWDILCCWFFLLNVGNWWNTVKKSNTLWNEMKWNQTKLFTLSVDLTMWSTGGGEPTNNTHKIVLYL